MRVLVLALFFFTSNALASDFCDGFEAGYIAAYQSPLTPFVPLCPMQPLKGFDSPKSDFEHGYLIGVKRGSQ